MRVENQERVDAPVLRAAANLFERCDRIVAQAVERPRPLRQQQ